MRNYPLTTQIAIIMIVIVSSTLLLGSLVWHAYFNIESGWFMYATVCAALAGIGLSVWFSIRFVKKQLTGIEQCKNTIDRFRNGDYTARINLQNHSFTSVASAFNEMADHFQRTLEQERLHKEDIEGKIEIMLDTINQVEQGDLTATQMVFSGNEGVDRLANGVHHMINRLNELVSNVQESGIRVTSSATEIAATAKQQEVTVNEQAASTNQVMASVAEISATAKNLAHTVDDVLAVTTNTAANATDGQAALTKMEQTMLQMQSATEAISSKLSVLSEKATNINNVITTITKVADQTNLLSLNAAIEAEKAGEYGLGFAVVATEIRRLADQTAVATWDIEQMVKEMQSAVSAGVMGMDKFTEEVSRGVQEVQDVGERLATIIDEVQALTPQFELVHEGMQSQSIGAEQINESMVQLNETAQQTALSLRQSNESLKQLNDAAMQLQLGVSKFHIA